MEPIESKYQPMLFGKGVYGSPRYWAIHENAECISIIPVAQSLAGLMWFLSLGMCGGIAVYWGFHRGDGFPAAAALPVIAVSLLLIIGERAIYAVAANNCLKGAYFKYDLATKQSLLPRQNLCFSSDQVVGWMLVHGRKLGLPGHQSRSSDELAELQLVTKQSSGEVAYVVARDYWVLFRCPIKRDAEHIALTTGMHLEICKI